MHPEPNCLHVLSRTIPAQDDQILKCPPKLASLWPLNCSGNLQESSAPLKNADFKQAPSSPNSVRSFSKNQFANSYKARRKSVANQSINSRRRSFSSQISSSRYSISVTSYSHASLGYETSSQGSLVENYDTKSNIMLQSQFLNETPLQEVVIGQSDLVKKGSYQLI